ncbi:MAG: TPM domain-containing protein [Saprospiraceae bacterium]
MLPLFRSKDELMSREEKDRLIQSIKVLEQRTSGEIRIYIEGSCPAADAMSRCKELFLHLNMQKTSYRNAVLLYIATHDRKFAIFGDQGIYEKAGPEFWQQKGALLAEHLRNGAYAKGIEMCIHDIGNSLAEFFPPASEIKNELPDDIVFGKF